MERRAESGTNTLLVSTHGLRRDRPDGVTNVITSSVSPLQERGFNIRLVGPDIPDKENNLAEITFGRGRRFSINDTDFEASLLYLSGKKKARKLFSLEKPELVVIHQPLAGDVTHALVAGDREEKICFVGVFHAQSEALDLPSKTIHFLARYWRRTTLNTSTFPFGFTPGPLNTINSRLDGRYAVSKAAREFWNQYLPGDYEVIYNGIDTDVFKPNEDEIKKEPNPDGPKIFFAAARFDQRKGLDRLLEEVEITVYKKGIKNFILEIAGDGKMRKKLFELKTRLGLDEYVKFLGILSKEDLIKHYRSADWFILTPTGGEAFGLVLGEAMACETPVIGSNIAGYDEVIGGNLPFAWMVNPNDPEDIASKIEQASKVEPDVRKSLGEQAREYVKERFSLSSSIDHQEQYLRYCLDKKRSSDGWKENHSIPTSGLIYSGTDK